MGKVGRPKKKITHFIGVIFYFFIVSVFVLILYPSPLTLLVVGFLWGIGEVAGSVRFCVSGCFSVGQLQERFFDLVLSSS